MHTCRYFVFVLLSAFVAEAAWINEFSCVNTYFILSLLNCSPLIRAVGRGVAGAAWATPFLKAREVWPLILHVHVDVHGPQIGPHFPALCAEILSTAAHPILPDHGCSTLRELPVALLILQCLWICPVLRYSLFENHRSHD